MSAAAARVPSWWGRICPPAAYRAVYGGATPAAGLALLERLERDERMVDVWAIFGRYSRDGNGWARLLAEVLNAHGIAGGIQQVAPARKRLESESERLVACAEALVEHFSVDAASAPPPGAIGIAREIHERAKVLVESCRWAAEFLKELPSPTLARFDALPNSRKKNDHSVAFGIMVADALERETGQPLYEAAAIITDVAFKGEVSGDAIRRARGRDGTRKRTIRGEKSV